MKVLILTHQELVPPEENLSLQEIENEPWVTEYNVYSTLKKMRHNVRVTGVLDDLRDIKKALDEFRPRVVFNLLEEFAGQAVFDQNVVSYLELLGVKYTGCNPRGLILCRDKALAKKILAYHRIPTPRFLVFRKNKKLRVPQNLPFPLFVKSLTEEASLGIAQDSIVKDVDKLKERIQFLMESFNTDVLAERFIDGREFYVSILGHERLTVFPTWELFFNKASEKVPRIYTNKAKWDVSYRKKMGIATGPAKDLPPDLEKRLHYLCRRAYRALQLSGYARMDVRITNKEEIFIIEVNPNPDIGQLEDFAQAAYSHGIKYSALLDKILKLAIRWSPIS